MYKMDRVDRSTKMREKSVAWEKFRNTKSVVAGPLSPALLLLMLRRESTGDGPCSQLAPPYRRVGKCHWRPYKEPSFVLKRHVLTLYRSLGPGLINGGTGGVFCSFIFTAVLAISNVLSIAEYASMSVELFVCLPFGNADPVQCTN